MSGTLRLRGATSGYSELQAPAVAADQTFILPTAGGTLLTTDSPVPKLTLELGSASQPSLTFEGDTDTGLYSSGTNTLNLVTGGNNRLNIDSSGVNVPGTLGVTGNVGIGTTTPQTITHIFGEDPVLRIQDSSTGTIDGFAAIQLAESATSGVLGDYWQIALEGEFDGSGTTTDHLTFKDKTDERMRIDSSGRLLVGTSSPFNVDSKALFQLSSTSNTSINFNRSDASLIVNNELGELNFFADDTSSEANLCAKIVAEADGAHANDDRPTRLVFSTAADGASSPTERLLIDSLGRIRINNPPLPAGNTETLLIKGLGGNTSNIVKIFGATTTNGSFAALGLSADGTAAYLTGGNNGSASCALALRCASATGSETTELFISSNSDTYANFFGGDASTNVTGDGNNLQIEGGGTARPRLSLLTDDTSISNGQEVGRINWWNNDGGWDELAYMRVLADESYSTGNKGSRITWGTTADGATTPTDHMILSSAGTLTVNTVLNVREAIDLADNDVLRFGSGDDAQMVHDGSHFYLKLLADDDFIITDENSGSLPAFRFDSSARRLYVQDQIYAGYNLTDYNTGTSNSINTYNSDATNNPGTWTSVTQIAADYRGKLNEATSEATYHFMASVKDRAGNQAVMSKIDVNGSVWGLGYYYAGRTQNSTTGTATSYYGRAGTGYGITGYNGIPFAADRLYSTAARAYVHFRASFDDADDRKSIYMVKSDTDDVYDYDQDQYLACSAMGRFDVKGAIRSGRVESDEPTPNQIYAPVGWGGGNGILSYTTNSNSYTAISGRTTANTDYVFRARVNQSSDKVRIQSDGQAYTDGAWNNSPADYAEYFEWEDGNPADEDRRGLPVVLVQDGKIRVATAEDNIENIIGVISAHPAFIGDAAELAWHGLYEKDEFGAPVKEDELWLIWKKEYKDGLPINQPKIDDPDTWDTCEGFPLSHLEDIKAKMAAGVDTGIPQWAIDQNVIVNKPKQIVSSSYDSTQVYIPRSKRKEWDTVGLIGKLPVVKGNPVGSRWIKMGEINNELDRYFVR